MRVIAVAASYLVMAAREVFTFGDVGPVVGREVRAGARNALRGPGFADIGSMAPLITSGILPSGRGDGPGLASSRDPNKGDGRLQELLGHRGLLRILDLNL